MSGLNPSVKGSAERFSSGPPTVSGTGLPGAESFSSAQHTAEGLEPGPTPSSGTHESHPPAADYDALLTKGLGAALAGLEISNPDEAALAILGKAALFLPDDHDPPISTNRLFAGAVLVGGDPWDTRSKSSYLVSLAQVVNEDSELESLFQKKVMALFREEPVEAALARLKPRFFSANVERILRDAASETDNAPFSDKIVRALLKSRRGLLYDRMPMDRIAEAVEKLRATPREGADKAAPPLVAEVDAALASLSISVTDQVRVWLVRLAYQRNGSEVELRPPDLINIILDAGSTSPYPTNPSAMLWEAASRILQPPPFDPLKPQPPDLLNEPADPQSPVRFSKELIQLLQDGYRKQREFFLNPELGAKGLIVGCLTLGMGERQAVIRADGLAQFLAELLGRVRARLREVVRERVPETAQQWLEALDLETASVPKLDNDQPWLGPPRDQLNITNDAVAIANVAAAKATSLPLAFGIFGDWGAGKTFFMRLIHDQIARVVKAKAGNDGFEHAIVQIQFNAWHYAETNLWASLVGYIFDELDRWMTAQQGGSTSAADKVLQRLATARQLTLEAASELVQRRRDHAKAADDLKAAQKNLVDAQQAAARAPATALKAAIDTAREAIEEDEELKAHLGTVASTLDVSAVNSGKAEFEASLGELNRATSAGNAALWALRGTFGSRGIVAMALGALVGIPLIVFVLRTGLANVTQWPALRDIGTGLEALGGLLAATAVLVHQFSDQVKSLAGKLAGLRQTIDAKIREATVAEAEAVEAAAKNLAGSESEVEKAKTVLQATGDKVALALQEYAEEAGSLRIRRFVRARAGEDGYGKHLGLISTIRRDFEQLESLMLNKQDEEPEHLKQALEHYQKRVKALIDAAGADLTTDEKSQLEATAKSLRDVDQLEAIRFGRIVLYIDDLDRCEPDKVVDVLQAVNMLLSFRLFVVMVAVDARWLSRSLETKYRRFFGAAARRRNGDASARRATAADYLEKIFQVPYWVPQMSGSTSTVLVGDLVAADRVTQAPLPKGGGGRPGSDGQESGGTDDGKKPAQPRVAAGEDDQPATLTPPDRAPGLTDGEIEALAKFSAFLGGSPRRARRFVNIYRVAKASLSPAERKELEAGDFRALAAQLAISTGAPNTFPAWIAACTEKSTGSLDERLRGIDIDADEESNLRGALAAFWKMPQDGVDPFTQLTDQARRAMRFSFVVPRRLEAPAATAM
jgi:hypothetical protein